MSETEQDVDGIGEHCSFEQCNRLDFLPISCNKCKRVFCKEHFSLLAHNCVHLESDQRNQQQQQVTFNSAVNAFSCSLTDCKTKEIIEFSCQFCSLNFCKLHRLQYDHKCSKLPIQNEPAPVKPIKDFNFELKKNVSEKNKGLAAKLMIMKMRKTATGPPGIPEELRFYCFVQHEAKKMPFYSSTKWPIGKFIEFLFQKMSIDMKLIASKKLFLDTELVDSALVCEEFVTKHNLEHGTDLILKDI